jgi:hypothetical protein
MFFRAARVMVKTHEAEVVQCGAVEYIAAQCSAVQCNACMLSRAARVMVG